MKDDVFNSVKDEALHRHAANRKFFGLTLVGAHGISFSEYVCVVY